MKAIFLLVIGSFLLAQSTTSSHAHSRMQRELAAQNNPELIRHGFGCDEQNPFFKCYVYRKRLKKIKLTLAIADPKTVDFVEMDGKRLVSDDAFFLRRWFAPGTYRVVGHRERHAESKMHDMTGGWSNWVELTIDKKYKGKVELLKIGLVGWKNYVPHHADDK